MLGATTPRNGSTRGSGTTYGESAPSRIVSGVLGRSGMKRNEWGWRIIAFLLGAELVLVVVLAAMWEGG